MIAEEIREVWTERKNSLASCRSGMIAASFCSISILYRTARKMLHLKTRTPTRERPHFPSPPGTCKTVRGTTLTVNSVELGPFKIKDAYKAEYERETAGMRNAEEYSLDSLLAARRLLRWWRGWRP